MRRIQVFIVYSFLSAPRGMGETKRPCGAIFCGIVPPGRRSVLPRKLFFEKSLAGPVLPLRTTKSGLPDHRVRQAAERDDEQMWLSRP